MGNSSDGRFADQNPVVLSQQLITAKSSVKSDLNTIITESNSLHATNTYLNSQEIARTPVNPVPAVTVVGNQVVGTARTLREISATGQPQITTEFNDGEVLETP